MSDGFHPTHCCEDAFIRYIGKEFGLTYLREGQDKTAKLTLVPLDNRFMRAEQNRPDRGEEAKPEAPKAELSGFGVEVQELTVEAALSGDRDAVCAAMALDPLCSRADLRDIESMTDELLAGTAVWLPQFA